MRVVVLGAGAVGAYYGGQLARRGHEVTCFARGANLSAIREHGLEIRTPEGTFRPRVSATDRIEELPLADFAILAVKSYSLADIAPVVRHAAEQGAAIVPFLNGVETVERLVGLGVAQAALLGGLTEISAVRVQPGVVERRSPFQRIVIGELDGRTTDRVARIAAALLEAGAEARVSTVITVELWQKFAFITTMAAACGLARSPVGPLRTDRLGRGLLERAAREVTAVARSRGIALPDNEVSRLMDMIDRLPEGMKPSFLVDLEAGGPTELDILSGAVSRFAEEAGIPAPVHDTATAALADRGRRRAVALP
ncbi:MAG TPA: ketopantoate reductase family protein [Gemmatimonadales bacterium]|nr:ketopantoate reductase family protein [Gemmatimonadales bacterium]